MDGASQVLGIDDIVDINRQMIDEFGGKIFLESNRNLMNPGPLEYILDAVRGSFFGMQLYPTMQEKAAAIAWRIITAHVFFDGNKRTGMESCRLFLEINGIEMRIDRSTVRVALAVANHKISFENLVKWVSLKCRARPG